jgi:hypothetical protein
MRDTVDLPCDSALLMVPKQPVRLVTATQEAAMMNNFFIFFGLITSE